MNVDHIRELVAQWLSGVLLPHAYDHTWDSELGQPLGLLSGPPALITLGTTAVLLERDEERHLIPWADLVVADPGDGSLLIGHRDMQLAVELEPRAHAGLINLARHLRD